MCFFSTLTRPSMYLSALAAVGSCGGVPVRNSPESTTPVTPGLFDVLQPPPASCEPLTNWPALATTASHVFGSGPTLPFCAGTRFSPRPTTTTVVAIAMQIDFIKHSSRRRQNQPLGLQIKCRLL